MKPKPLHLNFKYILNALLAFLILYAMSASGQKENARPLTCGSTISSYTYSESFEAGIGAWVQSTSDDFNWTRRSGGTPSSATGPSSAYAGSWYMYTESSNPNYPNKVAELISPCFDFSGHTNPTFNFRYHMYGSTQGTFRLQASTDGTSWTTLFTRSGNQTNTWRNASINLSAYTGTTVQLKFVNTTSGWRSDVAVDNINLTATVAAPNMAPNAAVDNASTNTEAVIVDVLSNDGDPDGDNITITSIPTPPNHGGSAVINNNGTPGNPADDYIDFTPSGAYIGVETFTYQICDDGAPSFCATAIVNVTIAPNSSPVAALDPASTDISTTIQINALGNDSDPNAGQIITLTSIASAPNHGGSAVINNNGTPGNSADDFIDFTPSGAYVGVETFTYTVCDNGNPNLCATGTVNVNISSCFDGSTVEASPNFSFGSEWKYNDDGIDLGSSWRTASYVDGCWNYGNADLGFGDGQTTNLSNHGGATYYFRKHFTVADVSAINYIKLDVVRDDGAAIYVNGSEVFRTNLPNGAINFNTLASSNVYGSAETATHQIIIPASALIDGDNVIAVEVHQTNLTSSDMSFDLAMSADMVDHTGDIYIAQGQYWNYNDNGIDLGTSWRSASYTETADEWECGQAELGYGDGDEATVISYGSSASNKYPTYYFRHYFTANDILASDSLHIKLRRDDGAVVYVNGVEVFRSSMPAGTINYGTLASSTAAGSNESLFFEAKVLATMIVAGTNVITVETHQVNATSSDMSFELELSRIVGDPDAYPVTYEQITGRVFLDADISKTYTAGDLGQGALEVYTFQDRNMNGEVDYDSDPRLFSYLTNPDGTYEVDAYYAEVQSVKSDVSASNEDAAQDGLGGAMSVTKDKLKSVISFLPPSLLIDTVSSWKYYDAGAIADPTWIDLGYAETGWSTGTADFGFGDPGITTNIASGNTTYYFRKTFTGGLSAASWNTGRIRVKRDDGIVIYLNGVEVARNNMPDGTISYSTFATELVNGEEEDVFREILFTGATFNTGANVLSVEIHQVVASSSDTRFDLMLTAEQTAVADVGLRFSNVEIPQGAKIVDAFLRVTSATTSEEINTIEIKGQNADNANVFTNTPFNISSRPRTTEMVTWSNTKPLLDGREIKLGGLKRIVQEITDRSGWSSGNSMAFILSGFENELYSFDGGHAPELTISYLDTNQTTVQYLIDICEVDLPETYHFLTDRNPAVTIGKSTRAIPNVDIGYVGTTSMCMATSEDSYNGLHLINRFSGKNKLVGSLGGSTKVEAIAFGRDIDSLFAVDDNQFGLIDLYTGVFTPYGGTIGSGNGADGVQTFDDIDGLAFDLTRNILWATQRRGSPAHDLIFLIDVTNGQYVPNAFGPGVDYIIASGGGLLPDLDDLAVNPNTGNLFAMNNDNGNITNLVEINVSNGSANVINPTGLNDMEGQGFHNDGSFYSTSGREGIPDNAFYQVDTSNSNLTLIGYFESEGDFEGCDCKTGPAINFIDGYTFWDVNIDSVFNVEDGDTIEPGVTVYLYLDADSSGDVTLRAPDPLIATTVSDADGHYAFTVTDPGIYVIAVEVSDVPGSAVFTTVQTYDTSFPVNGLTSLDNDFGFIPASALPVELASFTGENKGEENHLKWTTSAEINNDYFNVQRSSDAINFETIGEVDGAGNSSIENHYSFIDDKPFNGVNYYRLQQVDFDGTNEYSKTISLEVETTEAVAALSLNIWPNPAHHFVKIEGLELLEIAEEVTLVVFDISGVERHKEVFTISSDITEINLDEFENGMYFIEISTVSQGIIQSLNFIKQDK